MKQEIATGAINGFNMALSTFVSMVMLWRRQYQVEKLMSDPFVII
jgi:hypothetical protein